MLGFCTWQQDSSVQQGSIWICIASSWDHYEWWRLSLVGEKGLLIDRWHPLFNQGSNRMTGVALPLVASIVVDPTILLRLMLSWIHMMLFPTIPVFTVTLSCEVYRLFFTSRLIATIAPSLHTPMAPWVDVNRLWSRVISLAGQSNADPCQTVAPPDLPLTLHS